MHTCLSLSAGQFFFSLSGLNTVPCRRISKRGVLNAYVYTAESVPQTPACLCMYIVTHVPNTCNYVIIYARDPDSGIHNIMLLRSSLPCVRIRSSSLIRPGITPKTQGICAL